jgi:NAD(P)-dependent dehydrogenase (short-subunit alcohol dehydrogenase family)
VRGDGGTAMALPAFSLAGKVALVTGGRRGIGESIALYFAEAGADVAVCDRAIEDGELEAAASEVRNMGRRSLAIQADTSRKTDVDRMVEKVVAEMGTIDILVNNAGILRLTWTDEKLLKEIEASLPLGRIGEPDEVAGAALFLASDVSSYVTGHTILMEGGGLA